MIDLQRAKKRKDVNPMKGVALCLLLATACVSRRFQPTAPHRTFCSVGPNLKAFYHRAFLASTKKHDRIPSFDGHQKAGNTLHAQRNTQKTHCRNSKKGEARRFLSISLAGAGRAGHSSGDAPFPTDKGLN